MPCPYQLFGDIRFAKGNYTNHIGRVKCNHGYELMWKLLWGTIHRASTGESDASEVRR